jgi:serine/threonine-protein kinase
MIELGQTVGNYLITAKLGEGGMGTVYLAEHPTLGRKAALKVIHPRHAGNAEVVARFIDEATAIGRIRHAHIVDVTDFGRTAAGDLYFVMEYLDGRTLSEAIAREAPMPPSHALAIAAQIADALAASHARGVVHRDLKPDNVLLIRRGDEATFVKVLDFGLAKLARGEGCGAAAPDARPGIVMGTPHYMSPEQCRGEPDVGPLADVYALGVVLFEMLTGVRPFGGDGGRDVLLKHVSMRAPAARTIVPDLPEVIDDMLSRALAKEPAERFASMAAFREVLLAHGGRRAPPRVLRAARPTWRGPLPPPLEAGVPTTLGHGAGALEAASSALRLPRRRGAAFALIGAAALAGTVLAAGLTRGDAARALDPPRARLAGTATRAARVPAVLVSVARGPDAGAPVDGGAPLGTTLETRFQELR